MSAAAGSSAESQGVRPMPSRTRAGYHATSPTGTTVSRLPSAHADRPSSGNGASWMSNRQLELLISSAARGAQNARLPMMYSNASTTATDATTSTVSSTYQPGGTTMFNSRLAQLNRPSPATSMPDPVTGAKPSVSKTIHRGWGWMST